MTAPTLVLVDLDGTLTDSEPGIVASLRHAFASVGLAAPGADVLRSAIGPPFEIGLPAIGVPPDRLGALVDHYRERYEDVGLFENRVYDGVVAMLDALAHDGLALAVATAKPELTARRILEHFGLTDRFETIAGATFGPERRNKAQVIGHALARLEVGAGAGVVMVGDRDHDVLGAQLHGIDTIGVTWGYGTRDELVAAGAVALADAPADVVALVGRHSIVPPPDDMVLGPATA